MKEHRLMREESGCGSFGMSGQMLWTHVIIRKILTVDYSKKEEWCGRRPPWDHNVRELDCEG